MDKPSEGRIVHYRSYGTPGGEYPSVPRAAIITEVAPVMDADGRTPDGKLIPVGLAVLNPTGLFFNRDVEFDETGKPGTWRWPPRV